MKRSSIFCILLGMLVSCSSNEQIHEREVVLEETDDAIEYGVEEYDSIPSDKNEGIFDFNKWKDDFTYKSRINCFNEDSIEHFEAIVWRGGNVNKNYFKPVIGELAAQIEGVDGLDSLHLEIHEGTQFLYSIQKKQNHTGITIIGGNDSWVTEIKYLAFSQKGKKIGEVALASKGGDGGFYKRGHGCFTNDSTYIYKYIETEYNFETKEDDILKQGELKYVIHNSGKIETFRIK